MGSFGSPYFSGGRLAAELAEAIEIFGGAAMSRRRARRHGSGRGNRGLGGAEHGWFEAGGEEAGFEGVHAEQGVLSEDDALDGEAFLDDSEGVGTKAVLAGVLGSAGFAFGRLGPAGTRALARLAATRLGEVGIRLKV